MALVAPSGSMYYTHTHTREDRVFNKPRVCCPGKKEHKILHSEEVAHMSLLNTHPNTLPREVSLCQ